MLNEIINGTVTLVQTVAGSAYDLLMENTFLGVIILGVIVIMLLSIMFMLSNWTGSAMKIVAIIMLIMFLGVVMYLLNAEYTFTDSISNYLLNVTAP